MSLIDTISPAAAVTRPSTSILVAGLPQGLEQQLAAFFPDVLVIPTATWSETLQATARLQPSLLIVDDSLWAPPGEELNRLRELDAGRASVLFLCLSAGILEQVDLASRLVSRWGARKLFVTPIEAIELARGIASELGLRMKPQPPRRVLPTPRTLSFMASAWLRYRDMNLARARILQGAARTLTRGQIEGHALRHVEREVHKLVGSAGTFGYMEASLLAREAEGLLQLGPSLSPFQRQRLEELSASILVKLEGNTRWGSLTALESSMVSRVILAVTERSELAADLAASDPNVVVAPLPEAALASCNTQVPAAVLLDFGRGDRPDLIALLESLAREHPQVPVVVLLAEDGLPSRVALSKLGGRTILTPPCSAAQILEAVSDLRERQNQTGVRVLAVDDDPTILEAVQVILEPLGIWVETLADPTRFMEALERCAPDLILLDVDMPHLSGPDLCRAVRTDPRWNDRPVVFLSSCNDTETIRRLYGAGADDCLAKPLMEGELTTRILNRLSRTQQYKRLADTDSLTGAATRRRGQRELARLVQLARRQEMSLAVVVADLDHLKEINDRYGHSAGDLALRQCSRCLSESLRGEDLVIRWGGDEFVLAMYGTSEGVAAERLSATLAELVESPNTSPRGTFTVSFSAGVAEFPRDGDGWDRVLEVADAALYRAKENGRGQVRAGRGQGEPTPTVVDVMVGGLEAGLSDSVLQGCQSRGLRLLIVPEFYQVEAGLMGSPPPFRARVLVLPYAQGLPDRLEAQGLLARARVLLLTDRLDPLLAEQAMERGVFGLIERPWDLPPIMRGVELALAGRPPARRTVVSDRRRGG